MFNLGRFVKPSSSKTLRIAVKMCIFLPVQVWFLSLDVDGVEGVQSEPRGEREAVLVRPL